MTATLAPVADPERIDALDLIRGVALLGILFVNIQVFGDTFGSYMRITPEPEQGLAGAISFYFVQLFCESKFYPIFSMLFGVGLALQWMRARDKGRPYTAVGVRRMLALMAIGLVHALGIWYGDILFTYSICGLLTLPLLRCKPRTLILVAVIVLIVSTLLGAVLMSFMKGEAPPLADPAALAKVNMAAPPMTRLMEGFEHNAVPGGPEDPLWVQAETEAMRDGPYSQAFLFRAMSWAMIILFEILGMGWGIWAMFLLGVALLKSGFFSRERAPWHRRAALLGIGLGLPLMIAYALLLRGNNPRLELFSSIILHNVGSTAMSFGYIGVLTLLAHSTVLEGAKRAVMRVGRMGLTNYLLESLLATAIFYHWGLAMFAQTTRIERMGLVLGIYAVLLVASTLWLRVFQFGPMEWLWRSFTYLRFQPILRKAGTPLAVGLTDPVRAPEPLP
jgi:uncharacterized protein